MIKKNLFKRLLTIGLAASITAAMPVVAMAKTMTLGGNGYADCYVEGSEGYAYASTEVYANYDPDYMYAFVDVRIDVISSSTVEDCYINWDEDETTYGRYIAVSAEIDKEVQSNWRAEAYSYHQATIDDISDECMSGIGE